MTEPLSPFSFISNPTIPTTGVDIPEPEGPDNPFNFISTPEENPTLAQQLPPGEQLPPEIDEISLARATPNFILNLIQEVTYGTALGAAYMGTLHIRLARYIGQQAAEVIIGRNMSTTEMEQLSYSPVLGTLDNLMESQFQRYNSAVGDLADGLHGPDDPNNANYAKTATKVALWGASLLGPATVLKAPVSVPLLAGKLFTGGAFKVGQAKKAVKLLRQAKDLPGIHTNDADFLRAVIINQDHLNLAQAEEKAYATVAKIKVAKGLGEDTAALKTELGFDQERVEKLNRLGKSLDEQLQSDDPILRAGAEEIKKRMDRGHLSHMPDLDSKPYAGKLDPETGKQLEATNLEIDTLVNNLAHIFQGGMQTFSVKASNLAVSITKELEPPTKTGLIIGGKTATSIKNAFIDWGRKYHPDTSYKELATVALQDILEDITGLSIDAMKVGKYDVAANTERVASSLKNHPNAEKIQVLIKDNIKLIETHQEDLLSLRMQLETIEATKEITRISLLDKAVGNTSAGASRAVADAASSRTTIAVRVKDPSDISEVAKVQKEVDTWVDAQELPLSNTEVGIAYEKAGIPYDFAPKRYQKGYKSTPETKKTKKLYRTVTEEVTETVQVPIKSAYVLAAEKDMADLAINLKNGDISQEGANKLREDILANIEAHYKAKPPEMKTVTRTVEKTRKIEIQDTVENTPIVKEIESTHADGVLSVPMQVKAGLIKADDAAELMAARKLADERLSYQAGELDELPFMERVLHMTPSDIAREIVVTSQEARYKAANLPGKARRATQIPLAINTFDQFTEQLVKRVGAFRSAREAIIEGIGDKFVRPSGIPLWTRNIDDLGDYADDYSKLKGRASVFQEHVPGTGDLWVHNATVKRLQLAFNHVNPVGELDKYLAFFKVSHYYFSTFHAMVIADSNIAGMGLNGLKSILGNSGGLPTLSEKLYGFRLPGLQRNPAMQADPAESARLLEKLYKGNLTAEEMTARASLGGTRLGASNTDVMREEADRVVEALKESFKKIGKKGGGKVGEKIGEFGGRMLDDVRWVQQNYEVALWDRFHRNSKILNHNLALDHLLGVKYGRVPISLSNRMPWKHPGLKRLYGQLKDMDETEISQAVGRWNNDNYGSQFLELSTAKFMKFMAKPEPARWARRIFESPDWNISAMRQHSAMFMAIPWLGKLHDPVKGYLGIQHSRNYAIAQLVTMNSLNKVLSGKWLWENPSGLKASVDLGPFGIDPDTGEHSYVRTAKSFHDSNFGVTGFFEESDGSLGKMLFEGGADPFKHIGTHIGSKINATIRAPFMPSYRREKWLKSLADEGYNLNLPEFTIMVIMEAAKGMMPFSLARPLDNAPWSPEGSTSEFVNHLLRSLIIPFPPRGLPSDRQISTLYAQAWRSGDMDKVNQLSVEFLAAGKSPFSNKRMGTKGVYDLRDAQRSAVIKERGNQATFGRRLLSAVTMNPEHRKPHDGFN